jgi:predicted phosphodiesterase
MAKICGYTHGKHLKKILEVYAPIHNLYVPSRRYEVMTNIERRLIEERIKNSAGPMPSPQDFIKNIPPSAVEPEDTPPVTKPAEIPQPKIHMPMAPAFVSEELPTYYSRPDNTYIFGAIGDTHLGSKYERMDVLNDLYDRFVTAQVDRVFHTGNWIDGYKAGINEHDVHTHHMEGQLRYFVENYPHREGIVTYAITGEDHEGWWARSHGIDIGRRAEQDMHDAGREDWVNLGFMESHVRLVNSNTGAEAILAVVHPGGGTAYALSYSVQKIVEALEGGEKPSVALYGHYHKIWAGNIRNVWVVCTGCTQDQTVFTRNKIKQEVHVGGAIIALEQDPQSGAIVAMAPKLHRYFVKGFYNNRWNKSGPVQLPTRKI